MGAAIRWLKGGCQSHNKDRQPPKSYNNLMKTTKIACHGVTTYTSNYAMKKEQNLPMSTSFKGNNA